MPEEVKPEAKAAEQEPKVDVEKMREELLAHIRGEVKTEIAGLNRKITELETKAAEEYKRGIEEGEKKGAMSESEKQAARIAALEEDSRKSKAEAEKARREGAIKDLAAKHRVSEETTRLAIESSLDLETIGATFAKSAEAFTSAVQEETKKLLGGSYKPGSGNGDGEHKDPWGKFGKQEWDPNSAAAKEAVSLAEQSLTK